MPETDIVNGECLTSLGSILGAFLVAQIMRYLIKEKWPNVEDTNRVLLHEMVATWEKGVVCYELPIILGNAGLFWFLYFLTLTNLWFVSQWDETKSTIANHVDNLTTGKITVTNVFSQMSLELAWGFLVYPLYIKPLWSLFGHQPTRASRLKGVWIADIKKNNIGWDEASGVEFLGSFLMQMSGLVGASVIENTIVRHVFVQCITSNIIGAALTTSGGYFNPVFASFLLQGADGIGAKEIFTVYWVASITGTVLAFYMYKGFHMLVDGDKKNA